jgi:hypothetical protein
VNCVVPVRVRLVGRPTDDDLLRLEDTVARLVTRQLRAAQLALQGGGAGPALRPPLVQAFAPGPQPVDPFNPFKKRIVEEAREAMRHPVIRPGSRAQQDDVFRLSEEDLWKIWDRQDIKSRMEKLAEQVEASRPGVARYTKARLLEDWWYRFRDSVRYILTIRDTEKDPVPVRQLPGKPPQYRFVPAQLRRSISLGLEEAKLMNVFQEEALVAEVDAVRARYRQEWLDRVEQAAQRLVELTENDAELLIAGEDRRKAEFVFGLPAGLESEVTWQQAPDQLEAGAAPVAASVVRFWKAVQQEVSPKHSNDKAENYGGHETHSPRFTTLSVGKYSFDVHPSVKKSQTGFYERGELIEYFKAVEEASQKTGIEWVAYYNDATVIRKFNDLVKKRRIVFSGGGGHGQYHHGPEPYILHVHINIMPKNLAALYLVGDRLIKARKIFESWWAHF